MDSNFDTLAMALDHWGKYGDTPYKRDDALSIMDRFVERLGQPCRIFIIASGGYVSVEWVVPMVATKYGAQWNKWDDAADTWKPGTIAKFGRRWMFHLHPGYLASRFQWDASWPRAMSHTGNPLDHFWRPFPDFEGHGLPSKAANNFRACRHCTMPLAKTQSECAYCGEPTDD